MSNVLVLQDIRRNFTQGGRVIEVLRGVNLQLPPGQMVALVGPSGAGKSTLLQIAGLLEQPSSGKVLINNRDCGALSDSERTLIRQKQIGFVYQSHHLLPEFSAEENVMLPQMIALQSVAKSKSRARDLLNAVGLGARLTHRPAQLSGGEQQRIAIARALANSPKLLLADEPTGNLDSVTAEEVFQLFKNIIKSTGLAALVATHNLELARRMDRVLLVKDGLIAPISS